MKRLLLAAVLALIPSIASAQVGYVEGSIGVVVFPDINSDNYAIITRTGDLFEGNAEAAYNSNWAFGLEGGFQTGPWRFGVSWDFINAEIDKARLEGTLNGAPFTFDASDQDLEDFGIGGNTDVNVFAVNGYYDFSGYQVSGLGGVKPYLGLGIGAATVENLTTEFA